MSCDKTFKFYLAHFLEKSSKKVVTTMTPKRNPLVLTIFHGMIFYDIVWYCIDFGLINWLWCAGKTPIYFM